MASKRKYPTIEKLEEVISSDSMEGWCIKCGDWTHDCCEPDAHKYECPVCEQPTCYGAEELVIQGMVR
jgi:Zn finger protein HypA/HybF involved in hydrogenase expression